MEQVHQLGRLDPWAPFDPRVIDYLSAVSEIISTTAAGTRNANLASLGFWLRRRALSEHAKDFQSEEARVGRGLVFHVCPRNVPLNFAYSAAVGLLTGNINIVRLPSVEAPEIRTVVESFRSAGTTNPKVLERLMFVEYPRDDTRSTELLSSVADARVVWGGDSTVSTLRKVPAKPRTVDVLFANRSSAALLNASAFLSLSSSSRTEIARDFCRDAYFANQEACTAPRMVWWIGDELDCGRASSLFWPIVSEVAASAYVLSTHDAVAKLTRMLLMAVRENAQLPFRGTTNHADVVRLEVPTQVPSSVEPAGGYFEESFFSVLDECCKMVPSHVQTLSIFGFPKDFVRSELVRNSARGGDRVVTMGSASDFDLKWDGYDLVRVLSRCIA